MPERSWYNRGKLHCTVELVQLLCALRNSMRYFSILIFGILTFGCGSESGTSTFDLSHEYFKNEVGMFGYSAELQLSSNGTFKKTSVDYHSGTGGVYKGTYIWSGQLLTLKYQDSKQRYLFMDSAKLFIIEELDSLVADKERYGQGYNIYKLSIEQTLTPYSQPARTNWEQWNQGRIKNFEKMVLGFMNDSENFFEEN